VATAYYRCRRNAGSGEAQGKELFMPWKHNANPVLNIKNLEESRWPRMRAGETRAWPNSIKAL